MNHDHNSSIFEALMENINAQEAKFIDFRLTGLDGVTRTATYSLDALSKDDYIHGITINNSSLKWIPDMSTAFLDPFAVEKTMVILCNDSSYEDPRAILSKAMEFALGLNLTFIFDIAFHVFDDVRFSSNPINSFVKIDSYEFPSNSSKKYETSNSAHRAEDLYMQTQPIDTLHDIRSEILGMLSSIGIKGISHYHGDGESKCHISYSEDDALMATDGLQIVKYITKNIINSYGKTATFMPKPIISNPGCGIYIEQQLDAENSGYYFAGIKKHIKAINAFCNPTYGSYQRLNLEQEIRFKDKLEGGKVKLAFPDPSSNPYLMLAAIIMAGTDGVKNKIQEESNAIYASSLEDALSELNKDFQFLLDGGVFQEKTIRHYIDLKRKNIEYYNRSVNSKAFELDYGC